MLWGTRLTDLEVEDVVGADGLPAVLVKLFNVDGDGQALELLSAQLQPATVVAAAHCVGVVVVRALEGGGGRLPPRACVRVGGAGDLAGGRVRLGPLRPRLLRL